MQNAKGGVALMKLSREKNYFHDLVQYPSLYSHSMGVQMFFPFVQTNCKHKYALLSWLLPWPAGKKHIENKLVHEQHYTLFYQEET